MPTVTLSSAQDGYYGVDDGTGAERSPDGSSNFMAIGRYVAGKSTPAGTEYAVAEWNLNTIPSGASITSAYIQVQFASSSRGSTFNILTHQIATSWSESSLGIATPSTQVGTFTVPASSSQSTFYTVTPDTSTFRSLVAAWAGNPYGSGSNFGVRFSWDTPGSTDYWQIYTREANNSGGSHEPQLIVTYTATPAAPTLNSVTKNATKPRVDVAWTAPGTGDAPTGYKVDRATNNTFTAGLVTTNVGNVTNWQDTTTAYSTTYWYRVRGYNAAGDGLNSGSLSVTTDANPVQTIIPTGIPSAEAASPVVIAPGPRTITPTGAPSAEAVDPVTIAATISVVPTGAPSAEAVNPVTAIPGATSIIPTGAPSAESVDPVTIAPGPVSIVPTGAPSSEIVDPVTVLPGAATVIPTGVPSSEAVSPVTAHPGPVSVQPVGAPSAEVVDPVTIYAFKSVQPLGIPSAEAFGLPTMLPGMVAIIPIGAPSAEVVNPETVLPGLVNVTPLPVVTSGGFRASDYYYEKYGNQFIPVDSSKRYYLAGEWRGDPGVGQNHYFGFRCFDEDGLFIDVHMVHTVRDDSVTTLAADLHPGDAVVHLTDASLWWDNPAPDYYHGIGLWPYFTALGTRFDRADGYTRHAHYNKYSDVVGNDLILNAPWDIPNPNDPVGVWPAGTEVANMRSGGTYNYALAAATPINDDVWHYASAIILPPKPLDPDDNPFRFRAGTHSIDWMFLVNRDVPGGATIYRNLDFRSFDDPTHNLTTNGYGELGDLTGFTMFNSFVREDVNPVAIHASITSIPVGVPSSEVVSPVVVVPGPRFLDLVGVPSAEAFGLPTFNVIQKIIPTGVPSAEAFGIPTIHATIKSILAGIPSAEAMSPVVLVMGTVRVTPTGIPSAEAFGDLLIVPPGSLYVNKVGTRLRELILMFTPQLEVIGQPFRNGGIIVAGSGDLEVTSGLRDGGLVVLTVFDLIDSGALLDG